MELNYKKNNNKELFKEFDTLDISNIQNYIPIYNNFFNLNENNYNTINLNNKFRLNNITKKIDYSKFYGNVLDNSNNIFNKKLFFKFSPLVDPIKYMIGKFECSYNIFELPKFNNTIKIHPNFNDTNNSAYSDGFFSFLSSLLLNNYDFLHGIDYYGAFLGIKNKFNFEISDDIEYLDESSFFHKNLDKLFVIKELKYKKLFNSTKKNKQLLNIDKTSLDDVIDSINIETLENTENIELMDIETINIESNNLENNDSMIIESLDNEDSSFNDNITLENNKKTNGLSKSNSTCSSRYSNTDSNSNSEDNSDDSDCESDESDSSIMDDDIIINIDSFPVEIICLECCHDTLDSYIVNNKIKDPEWESIVLQILFILIVYQKAFYFTHNDLHTNNIVYNHTDKKYLCYKYNNKHYKVPTFGKIYKIIDFGRAIYKFKGQLICSNSYAPDGDANTQYNCEPYMIENKPRIDPNYSFDLCRLGCSLFDYFIDSIDEVKNVKSPIKKLILSWVYDDKNKNILYKNNGEERFPDFKLYKMIARTVHNHIPYKELSKSLFDKYIVSKKKINNTILNIDNIPEFV